MTDVQDRSKSIGGSDVAAILGISPFKTAYELYEEKVNGLSKDLSNNESVIWGNLHEPAIAKRYEQVTRNTIYFPIPKKFTHSKYSFLTAQPDALFLDEKIGLEIKTTSEHMKHLWGDSGSKQIPDFYYTQIVHYMAILNFDIWDVAVLIGGNDFRIYRFERDLEIEELILSEAVKFWQENILKKIPPEIDYSDDNVKSLIKRKFSDVSEETINLPDELIEVVDEYEACKRIISNTRASMSEAEAKILDKMGNCGVAVLSDGRKFIRKEIERKGYIVQPSKYVSLTLKKG